MKLKIAASIATSIVTMSMLGISAFASTNTSAPSNQQTLSVSTPSVSNSSQKVPIGEGIDIGSELSPYVTQNAAGKFYLQKVPSNLALTNEQIASFKNGLNALNKLISEGYFSVSNGKITSAKSLTGNAVASATNTSLTSTSLITANTVGRNGLVYYDKLTESQTVKLEAALTGGGVAVGTVAGILGLSGVGIPAAIVATIVAGVLGVGASYILYMDANGGFKGVTLNYEYVFGYFYVSSN